MVIGNQVAGAPIFSNLFYKKHYGYEMGKLKTHMIITAAMRLADQKIIPFYVMKKGDPDSGALLIEIETDSQHSVLYSRAINFDGIYEYHPISGEVPRPRFEIADMIEREISRDDDCWVIATTGEKGLQLFTEMA